MFLNKHFTYLTSAYLIKYKRFNVKSSKYYFHTMANILADFQICISVPLIKPSDLRIVYLLEFETNIFQFEPTSFSLQF